MADGFIHTHEATERSAQNSAPLALSNEMAFRRKWSFVAVAIALLVIAAIALLFAEGPASLQFIGYGTDGTGLLLLSNRTERGLDFNRAEIEVTEADTWTIYVQNYTIKSHRLDPYQSMVLRVDLPDGRFNWKATVGGAKESKIREDAAALLRKIGTNLQFADSEFRTGITVPESNYRSATNTTTTPAGVLEVIRVRPTDKGTRDGR